MVGNSLLATTNSGYGGTAEIRSPAMIQDVYVTGLGWGTPAQIDRMNGLRYLNAEHFDDLPLPWQRFIKLHEEGHYVMNTNNELAADEYGFYRYAAEGWPLSECIPALTRILDPNDPAHKLRVVMMEKRVYEYDAFVNKNPKALAFLKQKFNYA